MRGKRLEMIVLAVAFGLLLTAGYFMFLYTGSGEAVKKIVLVNRIFSLGFIVYIAYSYILSSNLNNVIRELNKNIGNLKDEVARQKKTIKDKEEIITEKEGEIKVLNEEKEGLVSEAKKLKSQLTKAKNELKKLKEETATDSSDEA